MHAKEAGMRCMLGSTLEACGFEYPTDALFQMRG